MTLLGSSFIDNVVSYDGGAVAAACTVLSVSNTTFDNNTARYNHYGNDTDAGGAIYIEKSDAPGCNDTSFLCKDCVCNYNSPRDFGGSAATTTKRVGAGAGAQSRLTAATTICRINEGRLTRKRICSKT